MGNLTKFKNNFPSLFSVKKMFPIRNIRKREEGNVIDMMGAVFVVIMLFAMILALAAYGSLVDRKLMIDNTVKEHLYLVEQYGYLRGSPNDLPKTYTKGADGSINTSGLNKDAESLVYNLLKNNGCKSVKIEDGTTIKQQAYGNKVSLIVTVTLDNPVYKTLGKKTETENQWFKIYMPEADRTISYTIHYSSTSRW